jgi:GDPmannose 4,6-dehydratase
MGDAMVAIITGITGQDGSYLAKYLLDKNYAVVGVSRSKQYIKNIAHIESWIDMQYGDITDSNFIYRLLSAYQPEEFYNLAGMSYVPDCWDKSLAVQVNGVAPIYLLDAIDNVSPNTKFFQASSREIFGNHVGLMDENTPYEVCNPYGSAKLLAHNTVNLYRQKYDMYACSGILFNHESPRRSTNFVTRKITHFAAHHKPGDTLWLGDLDSKRDWGFAGDFVKAYWAMLQQEVPEDYIIGTGELHSVREVCDIAFGYLGLDYRDYVRLDDRFVRNGEIYAPVANPRKARTQLGWKPQVTFKEMITMMLEADLEEVMHEPRNRLQKYGNSTQ